MRRILDYCSLIAALSLTVLFSLGATRPGRPSARKVTRAAGIAKYGNANSIDENELKIYDYFLASDQLERRKIAL